MAAPVQHGQPKAWGFLLSDTFVHTPRAARVLTAIHASSTPTTNSALLVSKLPDELRVAITKACDPDTRHSMMQVSKAWRRAAAIARREDLHYELQHFFFGTPRNVAAQMVVSSRSLNITYGHLITNPLSGKRIKSIRGALQHLGFLVRILSKMHSFSFGNTGVILTRRPLTCNRILRLLTNTWYASIDMSLVNLTIDICDMVAPHAADIDRVYDHHVCGILSLHLRHLKYLYLRLPIMCERILLPRLSDPANINTAQRPIREGLETLIINLAVTPPHDRFYTSILDETLPEHCGGVLYEDPLPSACDGITLIHRFAKAMKEIVAVFPRIKVARLVHYIANDGGWDLRSDNILTNESYTIREGDWAGCDFVVDDSAEVFVRAAAPYMNSTNLNEVASDAYYADREVGSSMTDAPIADTDESDWESFNDVTKKQIVFPWSSLDSTGGGATDSESDPESDSGVPLAVG